MTTTKNERRTKVSPLHEVLFLAGGHVFDLVGVNTLGGAPSFAHFAKGGRHNDCAIGVRFTLHHHEMRFLFGS